MFIYCIILLSLIVIFRKRGSHQTLSDTEAAFILNAERQSKKRIEPVIDLRAKPKSYIRLIGDANKLLSTWKMDYGSIYSATSSFLLQEKNVSMTEKLGLLSNAKQAQELHSSGKCERDCTRKNHASTGGFETTSDVIMSDDEADAAQHNRHENWNDNESFNPPDGDDFGQPLIDCCSREEKEQMRQQEQLLENIETLLQAMAKDTDLFRGITFKRLLQHWAVKWGVVQEAIEDLIRLLQLVKPQANFDQLPKSAKTLLKVPSDTVVSKLVTIKEIKSPVVGNAPSVIGEYMHFGVANAVLGISIGIIYVWEHRQLFRLIYFLFPKLLPKEVVETALSSGPNNDVSSSTTPMVPSDILQAAAPNNGNNHSADPTIIRIDVNIDGVVWFQSAASEKVVPILAKFHSISRGSFTLKMPSIQKPFIIGVYRGKAKCTVQQLCEGLIGEMKMLGDTSKSGFPFIVEISSFICDAPMRAELKGIVNFNGYYGCERCRTVGDNKTGSMKFPQLDAAPRLDHEWINYKKPEIPILHQVSNKYIVLNIMSRYICNEKITYFNLFLQMHIFQNYNNFEHEITGSKCAHLFEYYLK